MAPIFVSDWEWSQSDDTLVVKIFIPNCNTPRFDVFTADKYIKVNSGTHWSEIFLNDEVCCTRSTCVTSHDHVTFTLHKKLAVTWSRLDAELTKNEKRSLRESIVSGSHKAEEARKQALQELQSKLERDGVRQQIALNDAERRQIEETKKLVIASAFQALATPDISTHEQTSLPLKYDIKPPKFNEESAAVLPDYVQRFPPLQEKKKKHVEPPPALTVRIHGEIEVQFTPRTFPTPKRESTSTEEQQWLRKQREDQTHENKKTSDLA